VLGTKVKEAKMKLLKMLGPLCCGFLLIAVLQVKTAKADEWNQKTVFTFSAPIEVPGVKGPMVLPAGTYEFKLLDSLSDRDIVQIFNKNGTHLYTTTLAIPDYRMKPTGTSVIKFAERAAGSPEAIKAWFYPGDNYGQEFVYPKARAVELAKSVKEPVLSMSDEMASNMAEPVKSNKESAVTALEQTPVKAQRPSGEEVEITEVIPAPPPGAMPSGQATTAAAKTLPKTASDLPLLALCGILLASFGLGLRLLSRRAV
jgi:ribosomal protein L9